MKICVKALILFAITASVLCGQETHRTVTPSRAAIASSKPNSGKVPDVYAITGHFDRIVILRLKYKTDLLAGMEKMVQQEHIRNGVILAGLGSVRSYQIHQVGNGMMPPRDAYQKDPTGAADLVSMNGYVVGGKIHAHLTLAIPDKVIAGHLEPDTQVLTFAIVTIGVMNGADLNKIDDMNYR